MDKKADAILNESLANFYTIKHFTQEKFEEFVIQGLEAFIEKEKEKEEDFED
jgi:hypothetical protein